MTYQDMDFTDPAAMNLVLNDLAGEYLIATDNIAADNMVSGGATSGVTWTVNQTDPSSLMTALYGAAVNIASISNFFLLSTKYIFLSSLILTALFGNPSVDCSSEKTLCFTLLIVVSEPIFICKSLSKFNKLFL